MADAWENVRLRQNWETAVKANEALRAEIDRLRGLVDLLRQIDQALSYEDEVRLGLVPTMKEVRRMLPPLAKGEA